MLDQRAFCDVLGRFATGVVLDGADRAGPRAGMTVNVFMSVSLDPPLVALSAASSSVTWPAIRAVGGFAAAVLGDQHEEPCRVFAARGAPRFAEPGEWTRTGQGQPGAAGRARLARLPDHPDPSRRRPRTGAGRAGGSSAAVTETRAGRPAVEQLPERIR